MPAHSYMEEVGLTATLATKWSAGVTLDVNLRVHVAHLPWQSVALKPRRDITRSPKRVISGSTKGLQNLKKKKYFWTSDLTTSNPPAPWGILALRRLH